MVESEVVPEVVESAAPTLAKKAATVPGPSARQRNRKRITRRGLLTAGFAGASFMTSRNRARAAPLTQPDLIYAFLSRITNGFTLDDALQVQTMGIPNYLEFQLDHLSIDDSVLETKLQQDYPTVFLPISQDIFDFSQQSPGNSNIPNTELKQCTELRWIFSKRQLHARMTQFWSNHFSIYLPKTKYLKTMDDRMVIRANALGKFPDMLTASAHGAAMLHYLDNDANVDTHPNENYARELMELHTLGVDGPYTETDVVEVARCFTGWRFENPGTGMYGDFRFVANDHDDDPKVVLGQTIHNPGNGVLDGEQVLQILHTANETALFIARKMLHWLLRDDPSQSLVAAVAREYLMTGGDIKAMIRKILTTANLQDACVVPKFRSALDYTGAILRAGGATYVDMTQIRLFHPHVKNLGQVPFLWAPPNGYPLSINHWGPAQLLRWTYASEALLPTTPVPMSDLTFNSIFDQVGGFDPATVVDQINQIFTGGNLHSVDLAAMQAFWDSSPQDQQAALETAALGLSSPSFQSV